MAAAFCGFKALVENGPDAISLLNEQGEILYGSAANAKLFGYRPDELVGRDCLELVHPEDRDQSQRSLREVIVKPRGTRRWDARLRHKDGHYRWVESTVSNLLLDLEVQAIVLHQRNVNDRREAHERSLKQAEELKQSNQRMEEFAYTAAHDLREPLRAISAYTQMLCAKVPMDDDAREIGGFIVDGARRMSSLVNDLLAFAHTGMHGPFMLVDLQHCAATALQNLALEIEESGATIVIDSLPVVHSDETHLVRLFQNLISNAIKYRGKQPLKIHVSAERQASDWVISVNDNGVGIAAEYRASIFMPFIRLASREIPGTGLGLAVCKKIVEGLGGNIWAVSELGYGSTFAFTMIPHADI